MCDFQQLEVADLSSQLQSVQAQQEELNKLLDTQTAAVVSLEAALETVHKELVCSCDYLERIKFCLMEIEKTIL